MTLVLHELTGSPNNVKVRIGLGYKKLDYERKPVEPSSTPNNRAHIVALSRQPRLPVLEHDGRVIYDSGAILRYLDANFPSTPTLFSSDYAQMGEIEQWELWARTALGEPVRMIFRQATAPSVDAAVAQRATALIQEATARLEDRLSSSPFLLGAAISAADLACAPLVQLSMLEPRAKESPIARAFRENMHLGEGREKTRAWVKGLLKYDVAQSG